MKHGDVQKLQPVAGLIAMRFVYRKPDGTESLRQLDNWREQGHYIEGFDLAASSVRTFRKDRITAYLDDAEVLLQYPHAVAPPPARPKTPPDLRPQILFTGFPVAQRAHLESLADAGGLHVVKTVTQGLVFLCIGPNAGPTKIAKARAQHTYIVREPELHGLLETGELPDYAIDDGL